MSMLLYQPLKEMSFPCPNSGLPVFPLYPPTSLKTFFLLPAQPLFPSLSISQCPVAYIISFFHFPQSLIMLCHNLCHLPYPFAPCVTSKSPFDTSCTFCTFLVSQPLRFTHSASLSNKTTHSCNTYCVYHGFC